VAEEAVHRASSVEALSAQPEAPNRLERAQVQRLHVGGARRSPDDRRREPEPAPQADVVDGHIEHGVERARARQLEALPERTALGGGPPSARFDALFGVASVQQMSAASQPPAAAAPALETARLAFPSEQRGPPADDRDSPLGAAAERAALLLASTAGGARGAGLGGQPAAAADLGWGGAERSGSRAAPRGDGRGPHTVALSDQYFFSLRRQLRPYWSDAFPAWASARGLAGLAIVGWKIHQDGSVSDVKLIRSSGIREFDENVMNAVLRAAPFSPLPAAWGSSLPVSMTFDALNPAVGRASR
jgi:TonB family protein